MSSFALQFLIFPELGVGVQMRKSPALSSVSLHKQTAAIFTTILPMNMNISVPIVPGVRAKRTGGIFRRPNPVRTGIASSPTGK